MCVLLCFLWCVAYSIIVATADAYETDEWERTKTRVLQSKRAKLVVMIVHDAARIPLDVFNLHKNVYLFGLAPHVAQRIRERFDGHSSSWWLPVPTVNFTLTCEHSQASQCLSGFAMQVSLAHGLERRVTKAHAQPKTRILACMHACTLQQWPSCMYTVLSAQESHQMSQCHTCEHSQVSQCLSGFVMQASLAHRAHMHTDMRAHTHTHTHNTTILLCCVRATRCRPI